ncbi:MAG TPA: hypothetical protein VNO31_08415 [Umezawaea sp.]|jgi:hypothetical protein|nr:hypothetical protein [Umezawaea sp.]
MRTRTLFGAFAATAVLIAGMAVPATATERANVSQDECDDSHEFTEFFRNFDSADKYCYSRGGSPNSVLVVGLNHVTWFHSGVNSGEFRFIDGADGVTKTYRFSAFEDTGCTDCYIFSLRLDTF